MAVLVIEGLDGSGKSTQTGMLRDYLSAQGCRCRMLHFPRTESPLFGELIARFLRGELGALNEVNPWLVAMMYAGDRLDSKPQLEQWLADGELLLLDRYVYSNIAYQCAKLRDEAERQRLREWIVKLEFGSYGLPRPDLNIFLDVPTSFTDKSLDERHKDDKRQYLQGSCDIHEASRHFQEEVRQMYLSLEGEEGFVTINCGKEGKMLPPDEIFKKIINYINKISKNLIP